MTPSSGPQFQNQELPANASVSSSLQSSSIIVGSLLVVNFVVLFPWISNWECVVVLVLCACQRKEDVSNFLFVIAFCNKKDKRWRGHVWANIKKENSLIALVAGRASDLANLPQFILIFSGFTPKLFACLYLIYKKNQHNYAMLSSVQRGRIFDLANILCIPPLLSCKPWCKQFFWAKIIR